MPFSHAASVFILVMSKKSSTFAADFKNSTQIPHTNASIRNNRSLKLQNYEKGII